MTSDTEEDMLKGKKGKRKCPQCGCDTIIPKGSEYKGKEMRKVLKEGFNRPCRVR